MAEASFSQSCFAGGEWAPYSQGRFDLPLYKQAMNVCFNHIVLEQGSATRRSGTGFMGPTYLRGPAKFLKFESNAATPLLMEFTNDALRLWYGTGPVCTNDRQVLTASSSSAGVISVTTTTAHGWSTGDQFIVFNPTGSGLTAANLAVVQNRQLQATAASGSSVTLADDLGNALPSNISSNGLNGAILIRILRITTAVPAASLANIRTVQLQTEAVVLSGLVPQVATITTDLDLAVTDADLIFAYNTATFVDGPYNAPQPDTGVVTGLSGTITFTPASSTFAASDVGRHIRLFSEPPAWAVGTTYAYGDLVTYQGAYWQSTQGSNVGNFPGLLTVSGGNQVQFWSAAPLAGVWVWGVIATQATTSCTIALADASDTGGAQGTVPSGNGTTITEWLLGTYQAGAYPTTGTYHDGRLVLAGAANNQIDLSMSNTFFQFSPTDQYGNVNDNNAISELLNTETICTFLWFSSITEGLLCGTNGGELLISASTIGETLTPSNSQSKFVTRYKSAAVQAVSPGLSTVFVQRYQHRVMEYVSTFNLNGAGFTARHLNEQSKHLTPTGVKELAYQEEASPIVWCLGNDGSLIGCTYRRVSKYATDAPTIAAWHRHAVGNVAGTIAGVNSMAVIPGVNGLGDQLFLNTYDVLGYYWVEVFQPVFEDA